MSKNSSRKLQEIKLLIDGLGPVAIYYNNEKIFDEEKDSNNEVWLGIEKWNDILDKNPIIYNFDIDIVSYHHSRIYIYGDTPKKYLSVFK